MCEGVKGCMLEDGFNEVVVDFGVDVVVWWMMDCGLEGSTSSIYIWGRLLAVRCGMYMAEIRVIWCPTTNCTVNNIMMPFAIRAILFVDDWVTTPYYGRISYYYCRLPYTVCSILRTPAER